MSFDKAFAMVVGVEGGYVNDPRDPGGRTTVTTGNLVPGTMT